ncbi:MAG TPA: type VII secretion protein EccCa [Streptosporangiaceae bacterium]
MKTVVVRHAEGDDPPVVPHGEIVLQPPPEIPESGRDGFGQALLYLPMGAMAVGMVAMIAGGHASAIAYIGGGAMAVGMTGMMAAQVVRGRGDRKLRLNGLRRDYLRYLGQIRARVRRAAIEQRRAMEWNSPHPRALQWLLAAGRAERSGPPVQAGVVWRRRPGDPGFGHVRFAIGTQELAVKLRVPETKPLEDLDPLCAGALRRFLVNWSQVPGLPVGVSLPTVTRVALTGEPEAVRGLVRSVVAQLVVTHSPADVRICVCASGEAIGRWEWVKWLPHNQHPALVDAAGPARLMAPRLDWLAEMLGPEFRERPRFRKGGAGSFPLYVIVVDGALGGAGPELAGVDGVVLLEVNSPVAGVYEPLTLGLRVSGDKVHRLFRDPAGLERRVLVGVSDSLSLAEALALARQLAPLRTDDAGTPSEDALAASTALTALLGIADPRTIGVRGLWRPRPLRERLRVPIGVEADGQPVEIDIKEAAQGGMGPHGLIVGATGSGKSELLRTLVLGMALTHSPQELNFVLVDFKGGATFLGMERLPHVSAVITNLEQELPLVDRMQDALAGEIVRRQHVLRAVGGYASLWDYDKARSDGARLAPIPTLFVVIDEFSELLSAKPEFTDLFVTIGRVGRSLGVHLLLASQRLEDGKLRGLETQLSYRIGLRTFSAAESRIVLGVPDAYELPAQPGNGYLKTGTDSMIRFKAAYGSGAVGGSLPTGSSGPPVGQRVAAGVVPFGPAWVEPRVIGDGPGGIDRVRQPSPPLSPGLSLQPPPPTSSPKSDISGFGLRREPEPTLLDVVVAQLAGKGQLAHQIWLPPLGIPATLDQLLPPLITDSERGLTTQPSELRGALGAVLGIIDVPFEQTRERLWADLSGSGGHAAVAGAPRSGKSTLLRTMIISLALLHTPLEVQFYVLDFGGGALASLGVLPHVGAAATRAQPDRVRRTVAEMRALLEHREREFAEYGIDGIAGYRQRSASGEVTGDGFGDVFLVVDGWLTLRQDYEELEAAITALAARGLGYGIHLVASASKWSEFKPAVKDLFGTRLELRLGDPYESLVARSAAENVPEGKPGRGITRDKLHFLTALPRADSLQTVERLAEAGQQLAHTVADAWNGPRAPEVRMLPEALSAAELPSPEETGALIPFGIDEDELAAVCLDFDADAHFLVFGDTESGKSNLLRLIVSSISARCSPEQAKFIFLDYRRSLLDCSEGARVIGYATSSVAARSLMEDTREALSRRLPPPDLSPDQLRDRTWWSGSDLYLIVDDYDLVAGGANPLLGLLDLFPQARDIGLHVVLARSAGGAGRAMFEPVIQRLREMGSPGLILSGSRDEGKLLGGVTPSSQPCGRGYYVQRRMGPRLVQTALLEDSEVRVALAKPDGSAENASDIEASASLQYTEAAIAERNPVGEAPYRRPPYSDFPYEPPDAAKRQL